MDTLTTTKLSLIEGSFNTADAKEILLALLDNKIKFHQQRIFSHEERFGNPCKDSITRSAQLQKTKADLLALIKQCEAEGKELQIHSDILIEVK